MISLSFSLFISDFCRFFLLRSFSCSNTHTFTHSKLALRLLRQTHSLTHSLTDRHFFCHHFFSLATLDIITITNQINTKEKAKLRGSFPVKESPFRAHTWSSRRYFFCRLFAQHSRARRSESKNMPFFGDTRRLPAAHLPRRRRRRLATLVTLADDRLQFSSAANILSSVCLPLGRRNSRPPAPLFWRHHVPTRAAMAVDNQGLIAAGGRPWLPLHLLRR